MTAEERALRAAPSRADDGADGVARLLAGLLAGRAATGGDEGRPLVVIVADGAVHSPDDAWVLHHLPRLLDDEAVASLRLGCHGPCSSTPPPARPPEHAPGATVTPLHPGPQQAPHRAPSAPPGHRTDRARFGWASLTETETKVARLVADGHSNRSAAAALFVSANTVSTHLRSVFTKLDVNTRVQLTRVALRHPDDADQAYDAGPRAGRSIREEAR